MNGEWPADEERRRARRHAAAYDVRLRVEVYGSDRAAEPFFASGETVNISRIGVLAVVDDSVRPGDPCRVLFVDAGDAIRPRDVPGTVVRCDPGTGDPPDYRVAVEFDEPLLTLSPMSGS